MPLVKIPIKPGFNKQETATAAEGQWIDGDNVRFRYGYPEKIGGWREVLPEQLAGAARQQLTWTSLDGNKFAAIGTNKVLIIFSNGKYYDITPLKEVIEPCTFDSTTGSSIVTVNATGHELSVGDYIIFKLVTLPAGGETGYVPSDFTTNAFEVTSVVSSSVFTVTMLSNESGSGMSAQGDADTYPYVFIGPPLQTIGYGWGTGNWGEIAWGTNSTSSETVLAPGNWSLDNFGQILIATVLNGSTYTWDPGQPASLQTRAVIMSGAPTTSIMTIVSDRDRHLIALGTEETIGNSLTQSRMLIRFANQEDYTVWTPTATNTAGTFRLDTGSKIVGAVQGKDYILILTDTSAYVMQFVGPPFVFSIRQVGTNCGAISQHSLVYAQGAVWWMGYGGGFFMYDGTVKQVPCLVEDFVFTSDGSNLGINYNASDVVYGGHNSLFNEVIWFYPKSGSTQIDRSVSYNFLDQVWTTQSLARTTYFDATTYELPLATKYNSTGLPNFPVINGVTNLNGSTNYYEHETGTNEVNFVGAETAIPAYIETGEFDISAQAGLGGDGEFLIKLNRFVPDFKFLEGTSNINMVTRDYPSSSPTTLGPFVVNPTTTKIDTRVRNRLLSVKISSSNVNDNWRYGLFRLDIQPDGRR